jgi:mRNA-degrading endonuclease RelE of RelBE toxin-antitoxin system
LRSLFLRELTLAYAIEFAADVEKHLKALTARQRSLVYSGIEAQLTNQPDVETRTRKRMRQNPLAPWELRLGDLRVYYRVMEEPKIVEIAAVGTKRREQIWIGGERADI